MLVVSERKSESVNTSFRGMDVRVAASLAQG